VGNPSARKIIRQGNLTKSSKKGNLPGQCWKTQETAGKAHATRVEGTGRPSSAGPIRTMVSRPRLVKEKTDIRERVWGKSAVRQKGELLTKGSGVFNVFVPERLSGLEKFPGGSKQRPAWWDAAGKARSTAGRRQMFFWVYTKYVIRGPGRGDEQNGKKEGARTYWEKKRPWDGLIFCCEKACTPRKNNPGRRERKGGLRRKG